MNIFCDYLKRYQRNTVQKTLRKFNGKALLALDMGLGKSIISLSCMQTIGPEAKTLIVCPASLKYNWADEIEKFWPQLDPYICSGQKPPKSALSKVKVFICNYEILQFWRKFFIDSGVNIFIADESHYLKEKTAKRTKAAMAISSVCKYRILLTGTPIENKPIEIWSQLAIINPSFFPSWLLFAKRFNGAIRDNYGWKMTRATNTKELHQFLVDRCMIRLKKEDVLKELPPITRQIIPLDIDNRSEYVKAEEDIISWLRQNNSTGLNLEKTKKVEAQVRFDKLKLISARGKIKQVCEWINENSQNTKLVVFCYHREILAELHRQLDNHVYVPSEVKGVDRQNAVRQFQKDEKIRVFLSTIRVSKEGFNLTASNTTVFVQFDWNPAKHDQAQARVHRIGQTAKSVFAIYFYARNTIEERIMKLIDTKQIDSSAVIDGGEVGENILLSEIMKQLSQTK